MLFVGERRRSRRVQRCDPRGASEASGAIELVSCNPKRLGRVLSQESLWRMRPGASVFLSSWRAGKAAITCRQLW
jgi:hypothetical protein